MKYTASTSTQYVRHLREAPARGDARVGEAAAATPAAVVTGIREGMAMGEFRALAEWLDLTDDELAPLLGISRATLHRRRKVGRLEPPESERLVRFARLMARAVATMGDDAAAREWLEAPAVAFGGETPLSFADTEVGAREVEFLLGRLEHGVFA